MTLAIAAAEEDAARTVVSLHLPSVLLVWYWATSLKRTAMLCIGTINPLRLGIGDCQRGAILMLSELERLPLPSLSAPNGALIRYTVVCQI